MKDNELLKEKWRVQKYLASKSGYNVKKMLDIADDVVKNVHQEPKKKLRTIKRKQGLENKI